MANHGFVTTRKHLKVKTVDADIREFVQKHFGNLATVEGPEAWDDGRHAWLVRFDGDKYLTFGVWLTTRRKLEFRHPHGFFPMWAQSLIQAELGERYDGKISDEGVEGRWDPDVAKLDTYSKYVDLMLSHVTDEKNRASMRRLHATIVPDNIRAIPSYGGF